MPTKFAARLKAVWAALTGELSQPLSAMLDEGKRALPSLVAKPRAELEKTEAEAQKTQEEAERIHWETDVMRQRADLEKRLLQAEVAEAEQRAEQAHLQTLAMRNRACLEQRRLAAETVQVEADALHRLASAAVALTQAGCTVDYNSQSGEIDIRTRDGTTLDEASAFDVEHSEN
jgi:Skp family chaperone for outer membrane proteins